jgi:hypothetical protein
VAEEEEDDSTGLDEDYKKDGALADSKHRPRFNTGLQAPPGSKRLKLSLEPSLLPALLEVRMQSKCNTTVKHPTCHCTCTNIVPKC